MDAPVTEPDAIEDIDLTDQIEAALERDDAEFLNAALDEVTISEALRIVLEFAPEDRDRIIHLLDF